MGKSRHSQKFLIAVSIGYFLFFSSCAKKSDVQQANGDVLVKIDVQESADAYRFKVVQLKGIEKLEEVSGAFARFFYSPGSTGTQLKGTSPRAQFIHTKNFFVPSDVLSMQMATIYYHLQNLAAFDVEVGADGVNQWPRMVGLETQVIDDRSNTLKNNAFYNGQTDSMMFVPYTNSNLPISVNAGIIAHEHFHSLFYKIVIRPAFDRQKVLSSSASVHADENESSVKDVRSTSIVALTDKEKAQAFNETYLRGVNEGLADFWGWVYTDDPEFMRWSLPDYQANRTLTMAEPMEGKYETKEDIQKNIQDSQFKDDSKGDLVNYSYFIGTPHARFLKQFSVLQAAAKNISLNDSKKVMAKVVFNFIKDLSEKVKALKESETIDSLSLFQYVSTLSKENSLIYLDKSSCEFLVKYFNFDLNQGEKLSQCKEKDSSQKGPKDSSFVIVKP